MDHSDPAVDSRCPEVVDYDNDLQDRKDKPCWGFRNWIGRSVVGPVEEVGECILGEGTDRVEVGDSLAGRDLGASFLEMTPRRPWFGTDMSWDYTRHPWAHLRHTDRSLDPGVNDASAWDFHQAMRHNANYLGKQTYLLVFVVKIYCCLFELFLEYMAGTKVATSKSKGLQLVVLIENQGVVRAL